MTRRAFGSTSGFVIHYLLRSRRPSVRPEARLEQGALANVSRKGLIDLERCTRLLVDPVEYLPRRRAGTEGDDPGGSRRRRVDRDALFADNRELRREHRRRPQID